MSENWSDRGLSNAASNWVPLPGGKEHVVENTDTGEMRYLHVHDDQDVGDAIANGQFTDGDDDED